MSKLLVLSILVATVALPLYAGKKTRPGVALRHTLLFLFLFNAFYLLAMRYLYVRL